MNRLPEGIALEYASAELDVLNGVIDYAERMMYRDGDNTYAPLRRHAFGKTVLVLTEKKGLLAFRLSSTGVTYPNSSSGYATPHSPVGRLCSVLQHDDEDENGLWGQYRVTETRLFDRFDGLQFEENVRNFLRMVVQGDAGRGSVLDLFRTLGRGVPDSTSNAAQIAILTPALTEAPPTETAQQKIQHEENFPQPAIELVHLEVEDDSDEELAVASDIDIGDEPQEASGESNEDYYGLSELFFINRTREQDQVIARSPIGPMFVEGVAGSGKTSSALGRTKMLCTFNDAAVSEEGAFRDVASGNQEYWSGKYAGKFTQEGSIGFVRTGELIQYLKETCRRLDLPNLPVAEYKELQVRLRQQRTVERSDLQGGRWKLRSGSRESEFETRMAWLFAADRSIARRLSRSFPSMLFTAEELVLPFDENSRRKLKSVASVVCDQVRERIRPLLTILGNAHAVGRFGLNELAHNLQRIMLAAESTMLGQEVLWLMAEEQVFFAANEDAMASLLFRKRIVLFTRATERLVYIEEGRPLDDRARFVTLDGTHVEWNEAAAGLLADGKLAVVDTDGRNYKARGIDHHGLHLRLLPESLEKIFLMQAGVLKRLSIQRGLGRMRYPLAAADTAPSPDDSDVDDAEAVAVQPDGQEVKGGQEQKTSSLRSIFRRSFLNRLIKPLALVGDMYYESLREDPDGYPDPVLARKIANQMAEKEMTGEDIDLVLCLSHLVGKGFSGNVPALRAPSFHHSVFIDEVQDFTEQQVFLMAEQAKPEFRAVTVVGDIAQKLHHGSEFDIRACFPSLDVAHVRLTDNIRQMGVPALAWFSACFRSVFQDGLAGGALEGMLRLKLKTDMDTLTEPEFTRHDSEAAMDALIVGALKAVPSGQTAAVILPDSDIAVRFHQRMQPSLAAEFIETELSEKVDLSRRHLRHFTSVLNAKGLEFDVVILPMIDAYDLEDRSHINRLYVGLTRARKRLIMLAPKNYSSSRFDEVWARYSESIAELLMETL